MITRVTFRGTGQLNGPVIIQKTVDLDRQTLNTFYGAKKDQVITAFLANHYPGVEINPRKISIIQEKVIKPNKENKNSNKTSKSKSSSFTIFTLIFLPFKIIWKIITWLTKGSHV
ncbi:hypothetical protein [Gaetbulibacter saemankumensis]|uniref:hypothetical protein n=1 Tax=Gaetbulibacter saemankumensis TaxID=311208 RepID=UPI000403B410|nr:hypothetical protein [Gaetbulibacter saemankumensis]